MLSTPSCSQALQSLLFLLGERFYFTSISKHYASSEEDVNKDLEIYVMRNSLEVQGI